MCSDVKHLASGVLRIQLCHTSRWTHPLTLDNYITKRSFVRYHCVVMCYCNDVIEINWGNGLLGNCQSSLTLCLFLCGSINFSPRIPSWHKVHVCCICFQLWCFIADHASNHKPLTIFQSLWLSAKHVKTEHHTQPFMQKLAAKPTWLVCAAPVWVVLFLCGPTQSTHPSHFGQVGVPPRKLSSTNTTGPINKLLVC